MVGARRTGRDMEQNDAEEVGRGQHSHCLVALGYFLIPRAMEIQRWVLRLIIHTFCLKREGSVPGVVQLLFENISLLQCEEQTLADLSRF